MMRSLLVVLCSCGFIPAEQMQVSSSPVVTLQTENTGGPDGGCGVGGPTQIDAGPIWPSDVCPNALETDLPRPGGLLGGSADCPSTAPAVGAPCSVASACTYGSAQPGCFNREYQCQQGAWVDAVHTDPNVPFTATSCQVEALAPGCPAPITAFFLRSGERCALPSGTTCAYGHGGGARCVEFVLGCDGAAWHRSPEEPWAYCACTRAP